MNSQYWFRWWLGAVTEQANTWTNVNRDQCRHIALLGELTEYDTCMYRRFDKLPKTDIYENGLLFEYAVLWLLCE